MTELIDSDERKNILNNRGSTAISASAGSGKTTIMIKKMAKVLSEITNHQTIAATTFTNDATQEIITKLREIGVQEYVRVQTNDAFIESEIIRPFIEDTLSESIGNYIVDYSRSSKFKSFDEGISLLKKENRLGTYLNKKRNFKFQLAQEILKSNQAAREYFIAKYKILFIDEYQDSDVDMHSLFMYIKNELNIPLFVVGDPKQAIYLWRGSQPDIFDKLRLENDIDFFKLTHNFRSHNEITNYANFIHDDEIYNPNYQQEVTHVIHCHTNNYVDSFVKMCENKTIDIEKSITIISNINSDANQIAHELNNEGFNFVFIPRTPLDDASQNSYVLKKIVSYFLDEDYYLHDLTNFMRIDLQQKTFKKLESLLNVISKEYIVNIKENKEDKKNILKELFKQINEILGIEINQTEIELVFKTLSNKYYYPAFIKQNELHQVMTVFGAKGLAFDQVISFSIYYDLMNIEKNNNHYVCVTRAREKIIMFDFPQSSYSNYLDKLFNRKDIFNNKYLYYLIDDL